MKASRSDRGSAESSRRISPTASARRTLRRISWRSFLPSVGEVGLHVGPRREGHHRADVLALDVERPALGHLARPEGCGQGVRRRVAAAQPPQVDDVPRAPVGGLGEIVRERVGDGRQVRGRGQDRRVVGVVRGTEEDRGRGRRHGGELGRRAVAHLGVERSLAGLDLVAVHQREDGHRVRAGSRIGRDEDEGLLVGVGAVRIPPRALEGPAGERGRPRVLRRERIPRRLRDVVDRAALDAQGGWGRGRGRVAVGRRTGRLRVEGQGSHERMLHRNPDWLRRQPRGPVQCNCTFGEPAKQEVFGPRPIIGDQRARARQWLVRRRPSSRFDARSRRPSRPPW